MVISTNRQERRNSLMQGPFQPVLRSYPKKSYGLGKNLRKRSFQSDWFQLFKWLEYSIEKNAAFCFYCRFFPCMGSNKTKSSDNAFILTGFSGWHRALEKFKIHDSSLGHQNSMEDYNKFLNNNPIDFMISESNEILAAQQDKKIARNREYMTQIINIITLLAKGGKPLRGHRESEESHSRGLFLDIVDLLKKYSPSFKKYLDSAPQNCTYLSNYIQNDILQALSNVILRHIKTEVQGLPFSCMADETPDIRHNEQMSVVIRYSPHNSETPIERFIGLVNIDKTDAETIFNAITKVLKNMGLEWKDALSVCFDGAAAMSGCFSGVQARCKEVNPSVLYVHCYAHCLNLCLVDSCAVRKENPIIFDFFGDVQMIYNFIEGSSKRHTVFTKIVQETDKTLKTLKSLSETRWACRAEAVAVIYTQYQHIMRALGEIIDITDEAKARAMGRGILRHLQSFNFIIGLKIMHPILQAILVISKMLQQSNIDLCEAMSDVDALLKTLKDYRSEDEFFNNIYSEAEELASDNDIEIPPVKRRQISIRIDDRPQTAITIDNKKDEIKYFTFYPLLERLIKGINERFDQETKHLIKAAGRMLKLEDLTEDGLNILSKHFDLNTECLKAEVTLLKRKFSNSEVKDRKNSKCWMRWFLDESSRQLTYKTFFKFLKYFTVIPVTSCTCERSFSKLQFVLSKVRSTMLQDRIFNLLLPFIEQKIATEATVDEIIDEFKKIAPNDRRMAL